ncbi:MAG TPA: alpha/beta hydrolase [Phototrophicaceae bacterium]|nr:alpha/beta hydrolase [Phototrophicaceae bacterium]
MSQNLPGEEVEVFYFGPPDQSLFGIYHLPPPGLTRTSAILLCPPLQQEYQRCHRAYRQLAVRLAKAGFPVLRFDYYGTGDSSGDEAVMGLGQWLADVQAAADELKKRSRRERVVLIGLRLGAALAALTAAARSDVVGLGLWEPTVNGTAYYDELAAWQQEKLWYFLSDVQTPVQNGETLELLGQPVSAALIAEIQAVNLLALATKPANQVLIVEGEANPTTAQLKTRLEGWQVAVQYQRVDDPPVWLDDPDKALVPNQVLQAIVSWASEVVA